MRCKNAREIINYMLDDGNHPGENDALQHMLECADCAAWRKSFLSAVEALEMNSVYVETPDLSSRIISMLPDSHPAASAQRVSKWKPNLILGWTFASWVIGVAILCGLWFFVQSGFTGADINQTASSAYTSIRAFIISMHDVTAIPVAVIKAVSAVFSSYIGLNIVIIVLAMLFVFDTVVAAAAITIFKRKRVHGMLTI